MKPGRPPLPHAILLGVVAAATTLTALLSWRVFIEGQPAYLGPLAVCGLLVAVSGALLRRVGVPRLLAFPVQALVAAAFVFVAIGGSAAPTRSTLAAAGDALSAAIHSARVYEAPIGPGVPSIDPLLIVCGAAFLLVVDLIACGLRRVPIAGLPLLAIYSVPAGLTESGPGVLAFVGAAAGFLVLLHIDTRDDLLRWGRPLGPAAGSPLGDANPVTDAVRAGAGRIGTVATALALVLPIFVPVLHLDLLGLGPGNGGDDIQIENPRTDLRRDLDPNRPDIPLLQLTTDDPDPSYLRIAVLNRFTGTEWSSGDRDVDSADRADGTTLPNPPGLSDQVPRHVYQYDVDVTDDFESWWLPTMYPPISVDSPDDWRYDPKTLDFLSADHGALTTAGASYSMTAMKLDYGTDGTFFRDSVAGDVPEEDTEIPGGVPSEVRDYAQQVTEGLTSDYERAVALQQWFRRNFTYSLEKAPEGIGGGTFETFLNDGPDGRVGYCEQFASSMAAMARTLGIPARVAVGFLQPTEIGDGLWEYSSRDLHAWPELYFEDAGWVRFEPTPSARAKTAPEYTQIDVAQTNPRGGPGAGGKVAPGEDSTTTAPAEPTTATPQAPDKTPDVARADDGGDGTTVTVLLLTGLGLVLVAGIAMLPRTLRSAARSRRLAGGPEEVWAELRATATDLGVPWPQGRSPREVAAVLVEHLAGDAAPLWRVVERVERARYARPGGVATAPTPELTADAEACLEGLEAAVPDRARRRAQWWPVSFWRRTEDPEDSVTISASR